MSKHSNDWPLRDPPFCWGDELANTVDNFQSQILKRGESEKNKCLSGLKEFLPWIFAWGAYNVSCQKKDFQNKYRDIINIDVNIDLISNTDLGLF